MTNNGVHITSANAQLRSVSPAFFAAGKYAIATHADGSLVGPPDSLPGATPAAQGETLVLYGTGFGATKTAEDGVIVTSPVDLATLPAVTIGTTSVAVTYAGLIAAGLDQINVTVPTGLIATGVLDVPVSAMSGASVTQTGLWLTVQSGK